MIFIVPGSPAVSEALASVVETLTVGRPPLSLSAIVTVPVFGDPIIYPDPELKVRIPVSEDSEDGSSIGDNCMVALEAPAGIVIGELIQL